MTFRAPEPAPLGPVEPPPALVALRGTVQARPYDSRAITRDCTNTDCDVLPLAAGMAVTMDTLAAMAHDVGLAPTPRRGMSQFARQQGETFDDNILTDGRPLIAELVELGWIDSASIAVVNVNDHVDPPTAAGLTGDGGKPGEQAWRHYHLARVRYTVEALARAVRAATPTLLLRGVVETTGVARTPVRGFGEFDFALILPPGYLPPSPSIREVIALHGIGPGHTGVTVVGDAKSWRKLGRLDNGDKRATVARQLGLYVTAARRTWQLELAETVIGYGLAVNPPSAGGLSRATLTGLDLSDVLRVLVGKPLRAEAAVQKATVPLEAAVAAGARLDPADPLATTAALKALMDHASWQPSCLAQCPMGQACRRHLDSADRVERLGTAAVQAGRITTLTRLHALRQGAAPTASEADAAQQLAAADVLLGADVTPPWMSDGGTGGPA